MRTCLPTDKAFEEKGAKIAKSREQVFDSAEILLQVRALGANPDAGKSDIPLFKSGKIIIGLLEPLSAPEEIKALATRIIVLHQGCSVFDGSPQEYFQSKIHEKLYL